MEVIWTSISSRLYSCSTFRFEKELYSHRYVISSINMHVILGIIRCFYLALAPAVPFTSSHQEGTSTVVHVTGIRRNVTDQVSSKLRVEI